MLDREQIEKAAGKAGEVAYTILGLHCDYSIRLIDDRKNPLDAQLDTTKLEIQINLAMKTAEMVSSLFCTDHSFKVTIMSSPVSLWMSL